MFALVGIGLLVVTSLAPDIGAIYGFNEMAQSAGGEFGGSSMGMLSGMASSILVGVFMLLLVFVCGPMIAALLGIVTGIRGEAEEKVLLLGSGVGSFVGYFLMFVLVLFLSGTKIPGGSVQLGAVISNGLPVAIPSGLVAAGATYLTRNL